ncbi:MAG: single-stranded-DNA-specific exonuclease RecJ [Trueperaceae bacterium]
MSDAVLEKPKHAPVPVRWAVRPPAPPSAIKELCQKLGIPPILASVLYSRGLTLDSLHYLQPPLELTQIPDLDAAAERLELAIKHKKRILIHGDYDADGISGTAVLTLGLRALGADVTPFIPDRLHDGYGIHPGRVREHIERADVFVTVDCGITNLKEIEMLQAANIEVILSDHHQPDTDIPKCLIVHPKMSPLAKQGLPELTGAGVAFHLLWALHNRLGLEMPLEYADIASIGIIADVAPLMGENRALVMAGLSRMANSNWVGLKAAITQSRIQGAPTARDVAFVIAPRLNAAGRLGEADMGLELLMTASERRARELAVYLDARNNERRKIQDEMLQIALQKVDPDAPALVLDDPDWHPGVMGIVASHLLEKFYKPVYIIAKGKGSVRSTPGISAVQGLHAAAHLLDRFGGHSQAAGFAIKRGNEEAFKEVICNYVAAQPKPERLLLADTLLSGSEVDDDLYKAICELEPYGEGHPSPMFALTDTLDMARAVGKEGNTLQLRIGGIKGVAWRQGERANSLPAGETVNAVVSLRENIWNEKRSLEFIAEDIRSAEYLNYQTLSNEVNVHIFRGKPTAEAHVIQTPEDLQTSINVTVFHIQDLPSNDSLQLTKILTNFLTPSPNSQFLNHSFYFDISSPKLHALNQLTMDLPTLSDVRRGFVFLQRGQGLPFSHLKTERIMTILRELELLNEHNQPYRGQKRDPYTSETLMTGLLERYKLQTFIKAYKYLDDGSFAQAVQTLFSASRIAVD